MSGGMSKGLIFKILCCILVYEPEREIKARA